jgi:NADP-dependent 3-hydroxy acid dehydrogenase YdfG
MVRLNVIKASNSSLASRLPQGLIAVFVGGTSGIGEITLTRLAQLTARPKFYIVGRSAESAMKIIARCKAFNPEGEYIFLQKDLTRLGSTRELCDEIKKKENHINLLFLTVGLPDLSLDSKATSTNSKEKPGC